MSRGHANKHLAECKVMPSCQHCLSAKKWLEENPNENPCGKCNGRGFYDDRDYRVVRCPDCNGEGEAAAT